MPVREVNESLAHIYTTAPVRRSIFSSTIAILIGLLNVHIGVGCVVLVMLQLLDILLFILHLNGENGPI